MAAVRQQYSFTGQPLSPKVSVISSLSDIKYSEISVNEVFPLEERAEMEYLPYSQADERDEREPREVLHPLLG